MAESTLTAKGQTTVTAEVRALIDAKPGTRLVWSAMPDGTLIVPAKSKSILDMAGMIKAPKGDCPHVALGAQAGEPPLWTFDKAAAKVGGTKLMTGA